MRLWYCSYTLLGCNDIPPPPQLGLGMCILHLNRDDTNCCQLGGGQNHCCSHHFVWSGLKSCYEPASYIFPLVHCLDRFPNWSVEENMNEKRQASNTLWKYECLLALHDQEVKQNSKVLETATTKVPTTGFSFFFSLFNGKTKKKWLAIETKLRN